MASSLFGTPAKRAPTSSGISGVGGYGGVILAPDQYSNTAAGQNVVKDLTDKANADPGMAQGNYTVTLTKAQSMAFGGKNIPKGYVDPYAADYTGTPNPLYQSVQDAISAPAIPKSRLFGYASTMLNSAGSAFGQGTIKRPTLGGF